MHFETFTKVIDEVKDYCIWLTLYSWGEPFLNKQIDRFVAYADSANIATIISSNLNKPLTPKMVESLIRSGLDTLIVSIDGTTQDVYEAYRVGGRLDRVFENIGRIVEKKKELGFKTPFIEWQFIVVRQNEHQIADARNLAREIGVETLSSRTWTFPTVKTMPRWRVGGSLLEIPSISESDPLKSPTRRRAAAAGVCGAARW